MRVFVDEWFREVPEEEAVYIIEYEMVDNEIVRERRIITTRGSLLLARQAGRFVLHYQWFKGPSPVRRGPTTERWIIWIDYGAPKLIQIVMHMNPIDNPRVGALFEKIAEKEWIDWEGDVPPGTLMNPTIETPSGLEILDRGDVTVFEDGLRFKKFEFFGRKIAGLWAAEREPGTDYWWFFRTEAIEEETA